MEPLLLKTEWIIKCDNCGCDSHCGKTCDRTETGYPTEGSKTHTIEVCKQCRCEACAA